MTSNSTKYANGDYNEELQRLRTAGSVQMSAELFEKLYLTPNIPVKGDLRKTFGNPTPMCVSRWTGCCFYTGRKC
jgi:hypothetical protein